MPNVYPNREIFDSPPRDTQDIAYLGGYEEKEYVKTYHRTKDGVWGTYTQTADKPFDGKGHPFPEAIISNNEVKRLVLIWFLSFLPKHHWLEHFLFDFARLGESIYGATPTDKDGIKRNPILKEKYYNKLPKELWRLWYYFFLNLGISEDTSYRSGRIIATVLQYDDAYYIRFADIFTEMDYEALYYSPRKEILKALEIYKQREHYTKVPDRIIKIGKFVSYLLWMPKIKKAFQKAMKEINFSNLQLDDADRFHGFNRPEYDVCGNTWEERRNEFERLIHIHLNKILRTIHLTINNNTMPATQAQIDKVTAAISPLYADPDFSTVTDFNVAVTQTPVAPAPEVDQIDVPKVPAV